MRHGRCCLGEGTWEASVAERMGAVARRRGSACGWMREQRGDGEVSGKRRLEGREGGSLGGRGTEEVAVQPLAKAGECLRGVSGREVGAGQRSECGERVRPEGRQKGAGAGVRKGVEGRLQRLQPHCVPRLRIQASCRRPA